MFSPFRVKCP